MDIEIRPLHEWDIPAVMMLLENMHEEAKGWGNALSLSHKKLEQSLWSAMGTPRKLCAVAVNGDGAIIGVLKAGIYLKDYSDDQVAMEEQFYVDPAHRRTGAALRLIRYYKNWAEWCGVKVISMGAHFDPETNYKALRLFELFGFSQTGVSCAIIREV